MSYGGGYGGGNGYGQSNSNPYDQRNDNPYGQQQQQQGQNPYASQSGGYGRQQQQSNPYAQQSGGYGGGQQSGGYGGGGQQQNPYAQQSSNNYGQQSSRPQQDGYGGQSQGYGQGQDVEMSLINGGNQGASDVERSILDRCGQVKNRINAFSRRFDAVKQLQGEYEAAPDPNQRDSSGRSPAAALDAEVNDVKAQIRQCKSEMDAIQKTEGAGNPSVKGAVLATRNQLKTRIAEFQDIERRFQAKVKNTIERQIRVVNPNATPQEVDDAVNGDTQAVFSQALMQSGRSGQAQSVKRAVESRHAEIQKIAQQMAELAEMFNELNEHVILQETKVAAIDTAAEETKTHLDEGNQQLTTAVKSARAARKKKWICLGISVLIIIIIIAIVIIYLKVVKGK